MRWEWGGSIEITFLALVRGKGDQCLATLTSHQELVSIPAGEAEGRDGDDDNDAKDDVFSKD